MADSTDAEAPVDRLREMVMMGHVFAGYGHLKGDMLPAMINDVSIVLARLANAESASSPHVE